MPPQQGHKPLSRGKLGLEVGNSRALTATAQLPPRPLTRAPPSYLTLRSKPENGDCNAAILC